MKRLIVFSIGFAGLVAANAVRADVIIVPGDYATTESPSSDNAPLGAAEQHFQQVFSSTILAALHVGDMINGIAFRVQGGESGVPAQTVATYNISLSTAALPPGSLSATFADNRGADFQTVRSGPLALDASTFPGSVSPNQFGWIPFSTPYLYKGGNLLIEIAYQGFSAGRDADAVYPYTSGVAQTAFGTGYNSTTADAGIYDEAMVMGFSRVPVPTSVPEPSGAYLLGAGFLILGLSFREKRRG